VKSLSTSRASFFALSATDGDECIRERVCEFADISWVRIRDFVDVSVVSVRMWEGVFSSAGVTMCPGTRGRRFILGVE
jgi:hypothetical protein